MKTVAYLTTRSPSKLPVDLGQAKYRVFEATEVSEILHLCETQDIDVIVIGSEVADPDLIEAQMRRITIRLKPEATAKELIWELSQLFPDKAALVQ